MSVDFNETLREYLHQMDSLAGDATHGGFYRNQYDFVLRHGKVYAPRPMPPEMWTGAPKHCYGNSIILAAKDGFHYVEGFAIPNFEEKVVMTFEHAWCTDGQFAFDPTWFNPGRAYIGVEFSIERADDCTWNGDGCVLEDRHRGFPLLMQEWKGEDWTKVWPQSNRLDVIRREIVGRKPPTELSPATAAQKLRSMLELVAPEVLAVEMVGASPDEIVEVRRHLTAAENSRLVLEMKGH
jgi:hypothetical protein